MLKLTKSLLLNAFVAVVLSLPTQVCSNSPYSFCPRPTRADCDVKNVPTYFVGPNNCNDQGTGKRAGRPFCKVQVGLNKLKGGDTLMILDGVYNERVYLPNSGRPNARIVVMGESQDAIIDAGCTNFPCDEAGNEQFKDHDGESLHSGFSISLGGSRHGDVGGHVVLDGFTVRNAPKDGIDVDLTTDVTIQNMRIQNAAWSIVSVYNSSDFKLLRNDMSGGSLGGNMDDRGATAFPPPEESVTIVNTDSFEVANNALYDGFKEGIDVKVGSRNGNVHHNFVERMCGVGIYVNEASNIRVFGNDIADIGFIRNTMSDVGPRSRFIQLCGDVFPEGILEYEIGTGIMLAVGDLGEELDTGRLDNVFVYQNIIRDVNVGCLKFWDELRSSSKGEGTLTNVRIYNNVLYNCSRSGYGPGIVLDPSVVQPEMYNNIFARTATSIQVEGVGYAVEEINAKISHNLYFMAGDPEGDNAVLCDPLFVDPAATDFSLQSCSPAIDAGRVVGLPFAGVAPDIGAKEYGL